MDTVTRVRILDKTICMSYSVNTIGKGMHPTILTPGMGNVVGSTGRFNLVMATHLGEGKLWIQTC